MIRLLLVELTRLRWRRAVLVLVGTSILLPALIWVGIAWGTRPVSDSEMQHAQELVDQEVSTPRFQRELQRCERHPERYLDQTTGSTEQDCLDAIGPQVDWYLTRSQLHLDDVVSGGLVPVVVIVTGLLMLVGTTFAGADWNSGSMSNQLLFEPRRLRVWWAKGRRRHDRRRGDSARGHRRLLGGTGAVSCLARHFDAPDRCSTGLSASGNAAYSSPSSPPSAPTP